MADHATDTENPLSAIPSTGDHGTSSREITRSRIVSMEVGQKSESDVKKLLVNPSQQNWKDYCWNWFGLTSSDIKIRRRAQIGCGICSIITIVFIILLFLVIIPAIIQSIVDQSDMTIVTTEIASITNETFASSTTAQFSNVNGPTVRFKLDNINVQWSLASPTMVKLSGSNSINVKNDKQATLTSTATVADQQTFSDFNKYMMHNPTASWTFSGTADVTYIVKATVNINKDVNLDGYNNFSVPPVILSTNLTNGTTTTLYSQAKVTLTSLSNVILVLDRPLYFHFVYRGQDLGIGYIPNYVLYPGTVQQTSYLGFAYTTQLQKQALMDLLSLYSCGVNANVTLQNFFTDPPISWLQPALSSISMKSVLPATSTPMVIRIIIYNKGNPLKLPFSIQLYNPQSIPVTVYSIVGNVTYKGALIATVNLPNISPPIYIKPYSNTTSQQLASTSYVNVQSASLLAAGGGIGNIFNYIGANFSEFTARFYYQQFNVTLLVVKS